MGRTKAPTVPDLVRAAALDQELTLDSAILAAWRLVLFQGANGDIPLTGTALANLIKASGDFKAAGGGEDQLVEMLEWMGSVDDGLMPAEDDPGSTEPSDST